MPEGADSLRDDARKALAWEDIADEETDLRLDDGQQRQLAESLKKAQRDIKETVWRTYKNVMLLGKDGEGIRFELIREAPPNVVPRATPLFETIAATVEEHDPGAAAVPYLISGFTDAQLRAAIRGDVVASGTIVGRYGR